MDKDCPPKSDDVVADFNTYEDYLDSEITSMDLDFLEDKEVARQLAELGSLRCGEVMKRKEFAARKQAAEARTIADKSQQMYIMPKRKVTRPQVADKNPSCDAGPLIIQWLTLASAGKELHDPFLKELEKREKANRNGEIATIIFIRDKNSRGHEVSAYIDYAHRLEQEDFEPYFLEKERLLPRPTDLSFYNWKINRSTSNSSPNFEVIVQKHGLLFKNRRDEKFVDVNPSVDILGENENFSRTVLLTPKYLQVVFYDHIVS